MRNLYPIFAILIIIVPVTAALSYDIGREGCGIQRAEQDYEVSFNLRFCSAFGNARAKTWLGIIGMANVDAEGGSLTNDQWLGLRLLMSAARDGDPIAQNEVGLAYLEGSYGLQKDYDEAFDLLSRSTESGDEIAAYNLARMYAAGFSVRKDFEKALAHLRYSAGQGYWPAICSLEWWEQIKQYTPEEARHVHPPSFGDLSVDDQACFEDQFMIELADLLPVQEADH